MFYGMSARFEWLFDAFLWLKDGLLEWAVVTLELLGSLECTSYSFGSADGKFTFSCTV